MSSTCGVTCVMLSCLQTVEMKILSRRMIVMQLGGLNHCGPSAHPFCEDPGVKFAFMQTPFTPTASDKLPSQFGSLSFEQLDSLKDLAGT